MQSPHKRVGHLFQNRFNSIVCEAEPYVRELARDIHLNPLRAQRVPDLRALDGYSWGGHATIVGRHPDLSGGGRGRSAGG